MTEIAYVTREPIARALAVRPTAIALLEIDRACRSGSRLVDGLCHRLFAPETRTRTFDWPSPRGYIDRIDFDEAGLISATSVVSGGTTLTQNTHYFLEPDNYGPPYDHIRLNRNSSATFSGGPQRAVSIAGLWGWSNLEESRGTLAGAVSDSATSITLTAPADVGNVLRIGTERLLISGLRWTVSGDSATLTNSAANGTVAVADGTTYEEGETLLIDSERLRVVDIAGNTLTVDRAVDGSALAAHTAVPVYRRRTFLVERGVLGTTAASHSFGDASLRWVPPAGVGELAQAYAEDIFLQRNSGYARIVGSGESARQASGRSVKDLEARVAKTYGRGARHRMVA